MLRSTRRGLETWHGRDRVTLADERARQQGTQTSTYTGAPVLDPTCEGGRVRFPPATRKIDSGEVATRPGEAGNESEFDRIVRGREHDRNGRGRRLGCDGRRGAAGRDDDGNPLANQIGRQGWQSEGLVVGPAGVGREILP